MILRIVKMTFDPSRTKDFLEVFDASSTYIRNFEGCSHLELLKDTHAPHVYFTYSHWENEYFLDNYRKSELFQTTWAKTKILFSAKPEAWSLTVERKLDQ
jgi:quinol monooxygenase YgiN